MSVGRCGDFVWDKLCCRERFCSREFRVERVETVKKCGEVVVVVLGEREAGGGGVFKLI